ncbi:MAG: hypothetical protein ACKO01_10240 [Erythrobacter sp.]
MSDRIPFVDRLRDRGFIDQWGFIAFAVVGFAGIVSAKWLEVETVWVAVGAIAAMFAYAIIVGRAGTGRLRADQAGDNCYYLGLIYTLASLSYAIGTFDPSNTASTIVQGFGIALATTIFGLILRVFFSQGRPDLENVEEQTRLELTEAASRLKAELNGVVRSMNDFSRQIQQSIREVHEASTTAVEEFTGSSVEGLKSVVDAANEAIRGQANDFASRSKRYSASFDTLLEKLDQHGQSVENLSKSHDAIRSSAELTKQTADNVNLSVQALKASGEAAQTSASEAAAASQSVRTMTEQLAASVAALEQSLKNVRDETDRQIEQLKTGPAEVGAQAMETLKNAASALEGHLSDVSKLNATIQSDLTAQNAAALEAAKQHNAALESELGRSRQLVGQVHSALAEMTESLAKTVEGAA